MTDIAQFQIRLETDAAKRGAEEFARGLDRVTASAQKAGTGMAGAQNLLGQMRAEQTRLATSTTTTAAAFVPMDRSMTQLGRSAATAALQLAGVGGVVGRVAGAVGTFAVGGGVALAASAGIALVATALQKMREKAEETEKPMEALLERLRKLEEARFREQFGPAVDLANVKQAAKEAADEVDRLRTRLAQLDGRAPTVVAAARGELATAEAKQRELDRRTQVAAQEKERQDRETEERANRAAENERKRLKALADERARLRKQQLEEEQKLLKQRLAIEEEFLRNVSKLQQGRLGTPAQQRRAEQLLRQEQFTTTPLPANRVFGGGATGPVATILRQEEEAREHELRARVRQVQAMHDTRDAAIALVASLGVLPDAMIRVADTINRVAADLATRRIEDPSAGLSTGNALDLIGAGLGVVQSIFSARKQAELEAARFKAAQADFDRSLARFADSIGPQSDLQRDLRSLQDAFDALVRQAAASRNLLLTGGTEGYNAESVAERRLQIARELDDLSATELQRRATGLAKELAFLGDIEEVLAQIARAEEELRRQREAEARRFREDLEVRALAALGFNAESEARAFALDQQREYAEAVTRGFDQITLAALGATQALEAQAFANRQLEDAISRNNDRNNLGLSLGSRELRLQGRDSNAAQLDAQLAAEEERQNAERQLREGLISESLFTRWIAVIDGELAAALQEIIDQSAAAAAALALQVRREREDLEVRLLRAQGFDAEAEATDRRLRYERELAAITDEANRALLTQIYQTEEQAIAARAAADGLKAYQEALRAQADFVASLRERALRATGFGDAADDLGRARREQEEIDRAIAEGRTAEQLAEIRRVQALERQAADEARRRQQEEAFATATASPLGEDRFLPDSRTSVNLAVGVSESTGNRIAGMLTAQLALQVNLAYLPRIYEAIRQGGLGTAPTGGVSTSGVDQALAQAAADSGADVGLVPGMLN